MTHRPARSTAVRRLGALTAALVLAGGALTACSSDGSGDAGSDGLRIVASTTVYGDIAEQVAGPDVTVESVISDPTADPHSYEASPADAATVSNADLVVFNGAGYDSFVDRALENAGDVPVVRAVDEFERVTSTTVEAHDHGDEGHDHEADVHDHGENDHGDDHDQGSGATTNEHVWFHLPTAAAVAERIAEELAELDSDNAGTYRENAAAFGEGIAALEEKVDGVHDRGHFSYAQTEPIGAHLFEMAHMADKTPHGFLAAIEDDSDPAAADLTATLDLLREKEVDFLAFNTQTETSVTARVRDAARDADVPVIELTETLPDGENYLGWMTGIVDDLVETLSHAEPAGGGH
ncbi:metal ABC transporter solute-binding protein, Zn/Mn family [Dietzia sp. 179-F 9C3 NHS]|uniref:metal ABC transporter solute-binding protein, Zn/Mn family n=1 Tax=Dietzia sp. 179-F 9C3 NHS TaxID=3374295 RepID=UPI003879EC47